MWSTLHFYAIWHRPLLYDLHLLLDRFDSSFSGFGNFAFCIPTHHLTRRPITNKDGDDQEDQQERFLSGCYSHVKLARCGRGWSWRLWDSKVSWIILCLKFQGIDVLDNFYPENLVTWSFDDCDQLDLHQFGKWMLKVCGYISLHSLLSKVSIAYGWQVQSI